MVAQGSLPATASPKPVPVQDSVGRIPDLSGRGLREATYILESRGFKVTSEGKGKVVSQTPAAGTIIDIEKDCVLLKLAERHDTEKVNREDILAAD
ncbi:MAG: PASTA domain-containing protein [Bacteroidales bacterium]|nr:PASTA domain-containing protein [Bacteroidales bacterium]